MTSLEKVEEPRPIDMTMEEWEDNDWWPCHYIVSHDGKFWHVPIEEVQGSYDGKTMFAFNACGRQGEYRKWRTVRRRATELRPRSGQACKGCLAAMRKYYDAGGETPL